MYFNMIKLIDWLFGRQGTQKDLLCGRSARPRQMPSMGGVTTAGCFAGNSSPGADRLGLD